MKTKAILFILLAFTLAACANSSAPTAAQPAGPTATPAPTPLPSLTPRPAAASGKLLVDASQKIGPISPLVYGSNFGPRFGGVPLDVLPQAVAAKLTYMRFPDGNWGDLNDIDTWQIDNFITLCKKMGWTPAITVRLKGGTVDKAAELVKYTNITRGYKVQWWSIGNEPDLYPDYDTVQHNQEWRQYADAMRAVDPSIKLSGPDVSQFPMIYAGHPKDKNGKDWMDEFLKANGDQIELVTIHRYAFPKAKNGPPPTIDELRANSQEWDQTIPALRAQIRKDTGRDLPVGVTEVNSSYDINIGGEATMDSHYEAVWWADALGRMIRQGVDVVAQFELMGEYGLMDTHQVYPIYYDYLLYQNFGSQRLYASSDDPDVSVFAASRDDGAVTIMLVNLGLNSVSKPLQVTGISASGPAQTWLLDPDHKAEKMPDAPLGDSVTLPGQSVTLIVLK